MFIKYYLIYLKYYIYYLYEICIFICHIFLVFIIFLNNFDLYINKYLAFSMNILYTLRNTENYFNIKKIYLSQSNIQKINIKESYRFNIYISDLLFRSVKKYNYTLLKEYLNEMKLSGFIASIDCLQIIIKNKKYFKLNIQVNSIIKNINIYNIETLIISSNKLKQILRQHLGIPKNYKMLYRSIYEILLWYKLQGFEWISIKLIDTNNNHDIHIKIIEKKVISSRIICKNYYKTRDYELIYNAIRSEIKLLHGNILNKNKLDNKIKTIQQKYFLKNIYYKIINTEKGLSIKLTYTIYNEKSIKIYYWPNFLYSAYKEYENSFIKFLINLYKINDLNLFKYNFQYIFNLKTNYQYLYLFNLRIYLLNYSIDKCIQFFNITGYHYKQKKYYFNIFWNKYKFMHLKQKVFLLYLVNFKIQNQYSLHQSLECIQVIYNLIYKYYIFLLQLHFYINSRHQSINKYKKNIYSNIVYYKINFTNSYSHLYLKNISNLKVKMNYCILLYLNNYSNINYQFNKLYSYFFNIYLNNKWHFNLKTNLLNFEIQYNMIHMIINKLMFFKIFIINFSNINKFFDQPLFYFYINYSFYINKYHQLYLFHNYMYNMELPINNSKFFLGFGLQINIPFKKITHIRLEYIINMKKKFYLFLDKYSI